MDDNPLHCSFSLQLICFSEQPFYGNYSTLDSHTSTVISHTFAYSSRWRRKPWQALLLALAAECPFLKFSLRAWQKYYILSLVSLSRFSEGLLINISSKKNAFVPVFTLTILRLSAILKLDFLKCPGKSGSARPPCGMKLSNYRVWS